MVDFFAGVPIDANGTDAGALDTAETRQFIENLFGNAGVVDPTASVVIRELEKAKIPVPNSAEIDGGTAALAAGSAAARLEDFHIQALLQKLKDVDRRAALIATWDKILELQQKSAARGDEEGPYPGAALEGVASSSAGPPFLTRFELDLLTAMVYVAAEGAEAQEKPNGVKTYLTKSEAAEYAHGTIAEIMSSQSHQKLRTAIKALLKILNMSKEDIAKLSEADPGILL